MPTLDFSVEDALDLAHVSDPAFNHDGTYLAYKRWCGGDTHLVTVEFDLARSDESDPGEIETRAGHGAVSEFAWRPDHPHQLAFVDDGELYRFDVESATVDSLVVDLDDPIESLAWHPAGEYLVYRHGETLTRIDLPEGGRRRLADPRGRVADQFGGTDVEISPSGESIGTFIETDAGALGLSVFDATDGSVQFRHLPAPQEGVVVTSVAWVDDDRLVYGLDEVDGTAREYRLADVQEATVHPLLVETDDRGLARDRPVGTDDGRMCVLSGRSGHHHVYVVDTETRREAVRSGVAHTHWTDDELHTATATGSGVTQLTEGAFEARADAIDTPSWSPDGTRLAYVTNQHDSGERRLFVAHFDEDGSIRNQEPVQASDHGGNVVAVDWHPDGDVLLCIRAGRQRPAAVHVVDLEGPDPFQRVANVHPRPSVFSEFPAPEPVTFERDGGASVHGYLYVPPDATDGEDRPGVIWCHGGPMRQMRRGFHHMQSYAVFHAFNHVLVDRGYVVLAVNFRGGIGYGREYEHGIHHAIGEADVADCIGAATFLRSHPSVGDRVGLWGLSYGGFLANALAVNTDAVDCAVNVAGIWDWADWVRYAADRHWGAGRLFAARFGGYPDPDPSVDAAVDDPGVRDRYERASPGVNFDGLNCPLYSLHGTADPNVPFDQLNQTTTALVEAEEHVTGAGFEVTYYPDEDHMFQNRSTWHDALYRVFSFLDAHLRD